MPMNRAKLDQIDRNILRDLQDEGRITNVDLARRVGISAPPCLRRMRALEEAAALGYRRMVLHTLPEWRAARGRSTPT